MCTSDVRGDVLFGEKTTGSEGEKNINDNNKKNERLQSTKRAVFTLNLKTFKFFPHHCEALQRENRPAKHPVYCS